MSPQEARQEAPALAAVRYAGRCFYVLSDDLTARKPMILTRRRDGTPTACDSRGLLLPVHRRPPHWQIHRDHIEPGDCSP